MSTGTGRAFGDSLTVSAYPDQVCAAIGLTTDNRAVGGSEMLDICSDQTKATQVYLTTPIGIGDVSFGVMGYNDMRAAGSDATHLESFIRALRAAITWLVRLQTDVKMLNDAGWTFGGDWSGGFSLGALVTKYGAANGATASISVVGTAITVCYVWRGGLGDGAQFTVSIDGVVQETVDSMIGAGTSAYCPFARRYSGLSAGAHTVLITQVGSGKTNLGFVAGNGEPYGAMIALCGPLLMTTAGYLVEPPTPHSGSAAAVALYQAAVVALIAEAVADSHNAIAFDTNAANGGSYVIPTDVSGDDVHPNAGGTTHIGNDFIAHLGGYILRRLRPQALNR